MRWFIVLGSLLTIALVGSTAFMLSRSGDTTPVPRALPPDPLPPVPRATSLVIAQEPIRVYVIEPLPMPTVTVDLEPGSNEFVYTGVPQPLGRLLLPIAGTYTTVTLRPPAGRAVTLAQGFLDDHRTIVLPGSAVSIVMTETASLAW